MARLNKQLLVDDLSLHDTFANTSKREVAKVVDFILDYITDAVVKNDEVHFTGFGKFTCYTRQNGTNKPKFTPFTAFSDAVSK